MTMIVRIAPTNKANGYTVERFAAANSGYPTFVAGQWYEVDNDMAAFLKTRLTNPRDRFSRKVFQVMTHEQAEAVKIAEIEQRSADSAPLPIPGSLAAKVRENAEKRRNELVRQGIDGEEVDNLPTAVTKPQKSAPPKKVEDNSWGEDLADPVEEIEEFIETDEDMTAEEIDDLLSDDEEPVKAAPKPKKRASKKKAKKTAKAKKD